MQPVSKGAIATTNLKRHWVPFGSARDAFHAYLIRSGLEKDDEILLPAYIGWSSREGSGVFDPVAAQNLTPVFYRLDSRLHIDIAHLEKMLVSRQPKLLVIIHYFGYRDPGAAEVIQLAHDHGIPVLEDEAHAMLSDLIGGACGREGDAAIFSLHKLLPMDGGGVLVLNDGSCVSSPSYNGDRSRDLLERVQDYDLWAIASKRRENALMIHSLVQSLDEHVEPLWGLPSSQEVPQSYPVLIKSKSRDDLYAEMNEVGFGVTSLYHTLVSEIARADFPDSFDVSDRIMNLPVHQDIEASQIDEMMKALAKQVGQV